MGRTTAAEFQRFRQHQEDWKAGRIRLMDYVQGWKMVDGERVPMWYAPPHGFTVMVDKASLFDLCGYKPSIPQCRFHADCTAKILVFSGGARAGKSLAGAMEMVPVLLTPGTIQWIVAPEYDQAKKEFGYILESTVHHKDLGPNLKPFVKRISNRPKQGDMIIHLQWQAEPEVIESFVMVKTEKVQTSLLSEELDQVLMVEASRLKRSTWSEFLRMRLVTRDGRCIIPTSPAGMGWVAEIVDDADDQEAYTTVIEADTRYNPTNDLDVVERHSKKMTDSEFNEQVKGIATPKEGLVYGKEFDEEVHVNSWRPEWPLPGWRKFRLVDFGFTNPFVVLWAAMDEDDRFYFYREFYRREQLIDDVVSYVADVENRAMEPDPVHGFMRMTKAMSLKERRHRLAKGLELPECIEYTVADWDAQECAELRARGFRIKKAKKEIDLGIGDVRRHLKVHGDGRPALFVSPKCRSTIKEFRKYRYPDNPNPHKRTPDEKPAKIDDHAMDAIRYGVRTLGRKSRSDTLVKVLETASDRDLQIPKNSAFTDPKQVFKNPAIFPR